MAGALHEELHCSMAFYHTLNPLITLSPPCAAQVLKPSGWPECNRTRCAAIQWSLTYYVTKKWRAGPHASSWGCTRLIRIAIAYYRKLCWARHRPIQK